jgi:hypothetical protein
MAEFKAAGGIWPPNSKAELESMQAFFKKRERELAKGVIVEGE